MQGDIHTLISIFRKTVLETGSSLKQTPDFVSLLEEHYDFAPQVLLEEHLVVFAACSMQEIPSICEARPGKFLFILLLPCQIQINVPNFQNNTVNVRFLLCNMVHKEWLLSTAIDKIEPVLVAPFIESFFQTLSQTAFVQANLGNMKWTSTSYLSSSSTELARLFQNYAGPSYIRDVSDVKLSYYNKTGCDEFSVYGLKREF